MEVHAERVALRGPEQELSYGELGQRVRALAGGLCERGLVAGDRMAAFMPNSPEFLELYLASAHLGAILVPLNLRLSAPELSAILADADPRLLFIGDVPCAAIQEAAASMNSETIIEVHLGSGSWEDLHTDVGSYAPADVISSDSPAQIYYTSGTTGRAKGVILSHGNVSAHARAAVSEFELSVGDTWGHFAPMFHLADAWAVFAVTMAGGAHSFLPVFEAQAVFTSIEADGVTITNLVPTMLQRMVQQAPDDLSCVRTVRRILSGGAPIAPELVSRLQDLFSAEYVQTYGLTETSPFLTVSLIDDEIAKLSDERRFFYRSRTGRPFGGIELQVVDADGTEVPHDGKTVGEIRARGPWVFSGYWNDPERTAEAFDDGWFATGDLATVEERGYLHIVDRKKDVILCGGETVYSTEVENALLTHGRLEAVAAFPVPDLELGEVVGAALVRARDEGRAATAKELWAHCELFLARYKVPRVFYFLDELPLSGSGKVQKRVLRESCQALDGQWRHS